MVIFETFMQYKRIAQLLKAFNPTTHECLMSNIATIANKCVGEETGDVEDEKFYNMLVAGGLLRCPCLYKQDFNTYLVMYKSIEFYCYITSKQYARRLLELYMKKRG